MLKKRLVAAVFIQNEIAVQSLNFGRYLPLGAPEIAVEAFCAWGADEILLIDIQATHQKRSICPNLVKRVASVCTVPLAVGGGIRSITDADRIMASGADKICINSSIVDNENCLFLGQKKYGQQCMVGVIDIVRSERQVYVYDYRKRIPTNLLLSEAISNYIGKGIGELVINDVDRDGTKVGFDIETITAAASICSVPLIWCGGAGHPSDFLNVLKIPELSGAAAGNIFHFNEHSINIVKGLIMSEIPMRHDTQMSYIGAGLMEDGRLRKLPDNLLDELMHEKLRIESI